MENLFLHSPYVFVVWCLINWAQGQVYLSLTLPTSRSSYWFFPSGSLTLPTSRSSYWFFPSGFPTEILHVPCVLCGLPSHSRYFDHRNYIWRLYLAGCLNIRNSSLVCYAETSLQNIHLPRYHRTWVSLLHSVWTSSGIHPASYLLDIGGSFLRSKAAGAWSWPLTSI
jgi:hypothetical protein